MGDLMSFLQSIQLEHLAEIFQEQEITYEQLLQMNDSQFKEIGITKMGNRMKLLSESQKANEKEVDASSSDVFDGYEEIPFDTKDSDHANEENQSLSDGEHLNENNDDDDKKCGKGRYAQVAIECVPRSSSVLTFKTEEIQAEFHGRPDSSHSAEMDGTASEQVSALFESITLRKQQAKIHFEEIYNEILKLYDNKDFFVQLKEELKNEYGDIGKFISKGMSDLEDDSYPIVVTGETSSGKSTFVNLLLGVDILPQSTLSCTAAICRIHNSDEKKVTLTYKCGKQTDLDVKSDIEPNDMKEQLKQYVGVQSNDESKSLDMDEDSLYFVDIWWPIKNIPKDLLIVDTPGIGPDDPQLTEKLYQYLPKALAFIYILNTSNAGGVQKDRILKIQNKLDSLQDKDTCYNPNLAIFVCNKWDQIHPNEEDPQKVFKSIQQRLLKAWRGFNPEMLFRLSARTEIDNCKADKPISSEFKAILKGIKDMIPATGDEKLRRHVRKQKGFIESIQKKSAARIKAAMKTKEEKVAMVTRIREKIRKMETSIQSERRSVTEKAEQLCSEVAKRIRLHINDNETKKRMFCWSPDELPNGDDYKQIVEKVDIVVKNKITSEIKDHIQKIEAKHLDELVDRLFHDECFTISIQVDDIESLIYGDDYDYVECQIRKKGVNDINRLSLRKREKVFLAVSSPVWVPSALVVSLAAGLFFLPVGLGFAIKDRIKNINKISKYQESKCGFACERAEMYLESLSKDDVLEQQSKDNLLKDIKSKIDNFFCQVIPNRLNSAKALLTNIENDLREPAVIREACYKVESLIRPICGRILAASMDVFEDYIKTSDVLSIETKGDLEIATFSLSNNTTQQSVVKKVVFGDNRESGWKCLAEIHAFKRFRHHNLLKIYGVCVLDPRDIHKLYIFQDVYESDLAHEAIQNKRPWPKIYRYVHDALEGLSFLHLSGHVHKSVCLESIMIKGGQGKMAEMGVRNCGVRPAIRAPEFLISGTYRYESDIFQFGMVIWECWFHQRVYRDSHTFQDVSYRICQGERPRIRPPFPDKLEHCLKGCWHDNPDERPSAERVQSLLALSHYSTCI